MDRTDGPVNASPTTGLRGHKPDVFRHFASFIKFEVISPLYLTPIPWHGWDNSLYLIYLNYSRRSKMAEATPTTVAYKKVGDLTLYIDVHPPITQFDGPVPGLVYFHAGGMTAGDRASWFPAWLHSPSSRSRVCVHTTDSA